MSTAYLADDKAAALKLYGVNHATFDPHGDEYQWWKNNRSLTAIPFGTDRNTEITAAAAALSITLAALSTSVGWYQREASFWSQYRAKPPTALA